MAATSFVKLRDDLRQELHDFMNNMELRFTNFATKFELEQKQHHSDNTRSLNSIEKTGKETAGTTTVLETRMNLLFDEKGKGIVFDLQQEIKKLNNKVTWIGGAGAGAYIIFNILRSIGLIK